MKTKNLPTSCVLSDPNGAISGNYAIQTVWRDNVSQVNEKVRALNERAGTMNLSACDQPVKVRRGR